MAKKPLAQDRQNSQKDSKNKGPSYSVNTFRQSGIGLNSSLVWSALKAQLPNLSGLNVLDLGCGRGDFTRLARDMGAKAVTGVDASAKALESAQACERNPETSIIYQQSSIEDFKLGVAEFDLVVSLMTFHHLDLYSFSKVIKRVYQGIKPGGRLVMTVEHPICAVLPVDSILNDPACTNHWPKDFYSDESDCLTCWFIDDVIQYHPTVATYVNTLLDCDFRLLHISEPRPAGSGLAHHVNIRGSCHHIPIMLLAAEKTKEQAH